MYPTSNMPTMPWQIVDALAASSAGTRARRACASCPSPGSTPRWRRCVPGAPAAAAPPAPACRRPSSRDGDARPVDGQRLVGEHGGDHGGHVVHGARMLDLRAEPVWHAADAEAVLVGEYAVVAVVEDRRAMQKPPPWMSMIAGSGGVARLCTCSDENAHLAARQGW